MNEAQALLMCIPATAVAISVLIWLHSIHDRIANQVRPREMQEGNSAQEAAPASAPITIVELRTLLGSDGAAMPRVRFDVASGFSELGQLN